MAKVRQATVDSTKSVGDLVGIGDVELATLEEPGRMQRQFPAADERGVYGDGKEDVGVSEAIMVEEIFRAGAEGIRVERPILERNRHTKLGLFIALAVERNEGKTLTVDELQERAGRGYQRRGLVEMAVKAAKNPIELGNAERGSKARAGGVLDEAAGEVCLTQAYVQR